MTGYLWAGLVFGTIGFLLGRWTPSLSWPFGGDTDEPENRYGHPYPPMARLRQELPAPPLGYTWEVAVSPNGSGIPTLTVALVNVATGEAQHGPSVDLINGGIYQTWKRWYRNWRGMRFEQRRIFNEEVIAAQVDWAIAAVYRITPAQSDYTIGEQ